MQVIRPLRFAVFIGQVSQSSTQEEHRIRQNNPNP